MVTTTCSDESVSLISSWELLYHGCDFLLTMSECPRGHPYFVGEVSAMLWCISVVYISSCSYSKRKFQ